jgi:hypothetical protein
MNSVNRTLEDAFVKMRRDKNPDFSNVQRQAFYEDISMAILTDYASPNPYVAEASGALKPILDEAWERYKAADLGDRIAPLLEKYGGQVADRKAKLKGLQ